MHETDSTYLLTKTIQEIISVPFRYVVVGPKGQTWWHLRNRKIYQQ